MPCKELKKQNLTSPPATVFSTCRATIFLHQGKFDTRDNVYCILLGKMEVTRIIAQFNIDVE